LLLPTLHERIFFAVTTIEEKTDMTTPHGKPLLDVIEEIIEAASMKAAYSSNEPFSIEIPVEGFQPLHINAWDDSEDGKRIRMISVAHYFEMNHDLVPDPLVILTQTGNLHEVVIWGIGSESLPLQTRQEQQDAAGVVHRFAQNIRAKGYIEAAAKYTQPTLF
jgi:hypothetical protein